MKKFCTILAMLIYGGSVFSQDKIPMEFGIQHSFNLSQMRGTGGPVEYVNRAEYYELSGNRPTLDLGLFAIMHVSNFLSIQPELVYSGSGGHFQKESVIYHDLGAVRGIEDLSFKFGYVKLNLVSNIKVTNGLYLQLGGYGASLVSAELSYPWFLINTLDEDISILGEIESFDFGILGGVSVSTKVVNISFRYNHGLVDIFQGKEYDALDFTNASLQLVLHWKLRSDLR